MIFPDIFTEINKSPDSDLIGDILPLLALVPWIINLAWIGTLLLG